MNKDLKMLPVCLMLIAGATTGIITYTLHYEGKTALLILLGVLLFFYIAGCLFRSMILRFEKEQEEKERARLDEEGKVVEKDPDAQPGEETASGENVENSVKDAGEQQDG